MNSMSWQVYISQLRFAGGYYCEALKQYMLFQSPSYFMVWLSSLSVWYLMRARVLLRHGFRIWLLLSMLLPLQVDSSFSRTTSVVKVSTLVSSQQIAL